MQVAQLWLQRDLLQMLGIQLRGSRHWHGLDKCKSLQLHFSKPGQKPGVSRDLVSQTKECVRVSVRTFNELFSGMSLLEVVLQVVGGKLLLEVESSSLK